MPPPPAAPPPSPPATQLPPALVQAYRAACYEVALPAACTLQVEVHSPALAQAMHQRGALHACLLTACNPAGQLQSEAANAQRMQALRAALAQAGWRHSPAFGRDPQGLWPGEDSVLVWHMPPAAARTWGRRWAQNAVLCMAADAVPQLVLLR